MVPKGTCQELWSLIQKQGGEDTGSRLLEAVGSRREGGAGEGRGWNEQREEGHEGLSLSVEERSD